MKLTIRRTEIKNKYKSLREQVKKGTEEVLSGMKGNDLSEIESTIKTLKKEESTLKKLGELEERELGRLKSDKIKELPEKMKELPGKMKKTINKVPKAAKITTAGAVVLGTGALVTKKAVDAKKAKENRRIFKENNKKNNKK